MNWRAFNSGEVEALHHDVNAVMTKNAELEHSIATLQRELRELKEQR
jgi:predicted  nucleic acid-binding Zn-ribbon protein